MTAPTCLWPSPGMAGPFAVLDIPCKDIDATTVQQTVADACFQRLSSSKDDIANRPAKQPAESLMILALANVLEPAPYPRLSGPLGGRKRRMVRRLATATGVVPEEVSGPDKAVSHRMNHGRRRLRITRFPIGGLPHETSQTT